MYAVLFIYQNLSPHCYPFHSFKVSFSLSKDNGLFHSYHRRIFSFPSNLSIYLSPMSVSTRSYRCYHQKFNTRPSYFHHLGGGRVAAVHEEASPNYNAKRTVIYHRSLVPRGRPARGSVPQMLRYIYAPPPKTAPDQGMLNIYFLSRETLRHWRARMPE